MSVCLVVVARNDSDKAITAERDKGGKVTP